MDYSYFGYYYSTGVVAALPNISQIAPDAAIADTTPVVQIVGKYIGEHTNVAPNVSISGNGVSVQFMNFLPNGVEVALEIAENADTGNRSLSLTSDGVPSNSVTFRIGDRSPQITGITPPQGYTGEQVSVTITGTDFGVNPQVLIDGTGVSPTINSATSTEIQAAFSIADLTYIGGRNVKIKSNGHLGMGFNPGPGNSDTSNAVLFNVIEEDYTAAIETVGFAGNHPVKRWESYPADVFISNPTWVKNDSNNTKNVLTYTKGSETNSMNVSATLKITPAPPPESNLNAKVRIKYGGNVVATVSNNTPVNGNTITVEELFFDGNLESTPKVKKGTYNFDWEVSFDDGQTWKPSGTSQHVIFWTYGDVFEPANCAADNSLGIINRDCLFVNNLGRKEYPGLYDKALEKAIGELELAPTLMPPMPVPQTPDEIALFLAYQIDHQINYNAADDNADINHPLKAYDVAQTGVQCAVNANLLRGLLRSIGINNSETVYVWGGKPNNTNKRENDTFKEEGGMTYGYKVRETSTSTGIISEQYVSFKAIRPKNDEGFVLPENPHFTFHAMVKVFTEPDNQINNLAARYYDPSYAKRMWEDTKQRYSDHPYINDNLMFRKSIKPKPNNPSKGEFMDKAETKPFVVRAVSLRNFCLPTPLPNNTYTTCDPTVTTAFNNRLSESVAVLPRTSVFDAQGVSTFSVWRPSDGTWYIRNGYTDSNIFAQFGANGDKPVPGDFDGDGITDFAVFRPGNSTLYILESDSQTLRTFVWNSPTDKPLYGDFDGDGKSDIAFYRSDNTSQWFITRSSDNSAYSVAFGAIEDKPVSGDWDGDGKTDIAVFRPSNGNWYRLNSGNGQFAAVPFGQNGDIPVPGDYDGDGKTDIAVYRPSDNVWHFLYSGTGNYSGLQMGVAGDIPVPGDYDGDAKTDAAMWTPSSGRWLGDKQQRRNNNGRVRKSYHLP